MIKLENITVRIAGRTLIENLTMTLNEGHRYGLVGRNGTGKSTLFKVLLKTLHPDAGQLEIPARVRLGHVAQEAPSGSTTPIDAVMAADKERLELMARLEDGSEPENMADIYDRLIVIEAFTAESRASEILSGLGFSQDMQKEPLSNFSGGWRMRVSLASLLFSSPDWLLLDEPTNHLDLEASLWLEEYLKTYPKSLLIISHDRHLLNSVCDRTLFLHGEKIQSYGGNYDTFERTWEAQQESLKAQHTKQEAQRKHMQDFVNRFRAKASKAKQAQSRIKALEKMDHLPDIVRDPEVRFDFPQPQKLAPPLIVLDHVNVGYAEGAPILKGLSQRIDEEDRIALLGANGNGKSTFAKLIAGRLASQKGDIRRSGKLKVGYFAQHQVDEFDLTSTAFEHVIRKEPSLTPTTARAYLARFGLAGQKADVKVQNLSGGEKARLNLTLICLDKPNILILDEPTNHLDMDSRQALMVALNDFEGAVILITHDRDLLAATMDRLWLVADQKVEPFEGDLEDYRRLILKGAEASSKPQKQKKVKESGAALKKTAHEAKLKMEAVSSSLQKIMDELGDPELYNHHSETVAELLQKQHQLEKELSIAEEEWLKAEEEVEKVSS
ncbi:MAG TPA: ABC-F family ATP-binding cassette domain-containing protein [Alphaproteobacteria bacterium]|nr:ABC-F family ATP-binding cassette domain-containing protein [Alphaproteobacteria bacterium]